MSLFGGDSQATSPAETESELSQPPSRQPSPSAAQPPSPHDVHVAQDPIHSSEIGSTGSSDRDLSESDESESTRPNRFKGRKETWKAYTAADRQIYTSLGQERNADLAAHLYNAHALKRRALRPEDELADVKPWQSREQWMKREKELEYTDELGEVQTHLVPSKDWTAWPLPQAELPMRDRGRVIDGDFYGTFHAQDVGEDMRQELLAVFSRLAKEQWNRREPADEKDRARTEKRQSRSRSRSIKAQSTSRPPSSAASTRRNSDDDSMQSADEENMDEDEHKFPNIVGKKRGRKPQPELTSKPVFHADDAKERRILLPTINSMLNNLDDLLLAVRCTRMNHFGRGADSDMSSHSDFTSGAESERPTSRSRSRSQSTKSADKRQRGRDATRRKDAGASSDNEHEMKTTSAESSRRKRARSGSTAGDRSASASRDETSRLGLMDWSEVLALAAVKGWDERVLARTAQRCANLFGQSISFHILDESRATQPIPDPVTYTPSTITGPSDLYRPSEKRPLFQTGTLHCPHVGCYGHDKDFAYPYRVIEHCVRVHGYDPRTNDSENEQRTIGGVHIDGFLQPIPAQHGWLGRGRSKAGGKRKRMKRKEGEESHDADYEGSMDVD